MKVTNESSRCGDNAFKLINGVFVPIDQQIVMNFQHNTLKQIGGAFNVLDAQESPLCTLKGKWTGWNFNFAKGDTVFANVSKEWAGMGKELFTSADNYVISISDDVPADNPFRKLIFAAVMCIDMVLKE